jgi:hypothetical protein
MPIQAVTGVFFSVQAVENLEDPALECGVYVRTIVRDGEYPVEIRPCG